MSIRTSHIASAIFAIALVAPTVASAAPSSTTNSAVHLLAASSGDLVPTRLSSVEPTQIAMDHAPVSISWALSGDQKLQATPKPFLRISRQYMVDASAAEVETGVNLPLTARGDIVRISPQDQASAPIDATQLQFTTHAGQRLSAAKASAVMASDRSLQRAGMPVKPGSLALKLNDSFGVGIAQITAKAASGHYLIQVYEPKSPLTLALSADHGTRLAGQSLQFTVSLIQSSSHAASANLAGASPKSAIGKPVTPINSIHPVIAAALSRVTGVLQAPDGWSTNVEFSPGPNGTYVATVTPPAQHAGQRGLWEIHAFASGQGGGLTLRRDASNAFALVLPTARFNGSLARPAARGSSHGLSMNIGLDVAAASRYAVSAVLYGHDASGQLRPAAYAQSANWLEPGQNRHIRLSFSSAAIAKSGLKGPFVLRNLTLEDQMQLGLLERRALAVRGLTAN